jgi:hypothetical protein
MMTDFRALCAELVDAWLKGDDIVGAMNRARATLADEPVVPAPPADGEVAELVRTLTGIAHWRRRGRPGEGDPSPFDIRQADRLDRAAELLQRHVVVPVAVSVRLPGPEDCDAEGRCWWFAPETEVDFGGWTFGTTEICANSQWVDWENTHWLPAHALPLPEVDE